MSDELAAAIEADALKPQSVSADGVSISRRSTSDQIAAKKFSDANSAIDSIAAGTHFMGRVRMVPPGAGGTNADC